MLTVSAADYAASLVSWLALVPTQTLDDFHAFSRSSPLVFTFTTDSQVCHRDP